MSTEMHEPTRTGWRHTPLSRMPKGGREGGKLGGVVAGLSKAYGFDLTTTRVAVVIGTFLLPALALVYLAAWVLLPPTPAEARPIEQVLTDRRRMPLLIAIALVLVMGGLGSLGSWFLFRGAPWGLLLIGLGVLLWMSTRRDGGGTTATPPAPGPTPEPTAATPMPVVITPLDVTDTVTDTVPTTPVPTTEVPHTTSFPPPAVAAVPPTAAAAPARRVRAPRRPIGSIGVGIAVLWFAFAAAVEALGWWNAPALWVIVIGLGIVMVALFISTIVNRSVLLPIPLALVGMVVALLCVAQPDLDGASGQRTVRPATVAAATEAQHLAAGQLTIDLRDVPFTPGEPLPITAEVGAGRLRVLVPTDLDVLVRTDVGAGQAEVWGDEVSDGIRQDATRVAEAERTPVAGAVELDLRVGLGQISVERVASEG